ncbi:alpha/beta fold hydrolase [Rhizobium mesosinicum]|uniref:Alpha/beta hydrolase n=1 Tax=Rhizobium mesosinicum TaxID=335017 RepID=A0ABS7GM36_9HYPH|nr:alpha/beta hydrolase [Rhizobium mesosinicum]MBW9051067.1 alpha/beta hydrolase [Rhizobium mesosinicum]
MLTKSPSTYPVTHHRTKTIKDIDIFYREAGSPSAPAVVLLHGFPTSSHMFRNLIPFLADEYHVIAPDLPGFGLSGMPPREDFEYSFANFADIVDELLETLEVDRYVLYVMDYGAPTGFRLALKHPDRVAGIVTQNGNAYEDGLQGFWDPIRALWKENSPQNRDALRPFMSLEITKFQYLDGVADQSRIDPSNWIVDQHFLDRPGNEEIQLDLFYDYRNNVALYPKFQEYFREYKPPMLVAWGAKDSIFPAAGANAFLRDNPDAELHLLDSGHFAFEDKADVIVPLMRDFLGRVY